MRELCEDVLAVFIGFAAGALLGVAVAAAIAGGTYLCLALLFWLVGP